MLKAVNDEPDKFSGIGFVLTDNDPFVGFDFDKCLQKGRQESDEVKWLIKNLNSYTESSPSGTGLRIICKGSAPDYIRKKRSDIKGIPSAEVYNSGRFLTMTGRVIVEHTLDINEVDSTFWPEYAKMGNGAIAKTSNYKSSGYSVATFDKVLMDLRNDSEIGTVFRSLYDYGDLSRHNDDHSAADLRLCGLVANKVGYHADIIDAIFRESKLYRDKWDTNHRADGATYGQMTIENVLNTRFIKNSSEIEDFLSYHYNFRHNVVLGRLEIKNRSDLKWIDLDDYQFNSIQRFIQKRNGKISEAKLRMHLGSDFVEQFDPFKAYFEGLPVPKDVETRKELKKLLKQIPVSANERVYFEDTFTRWLVAVVACAIVEDAKNHCAVIWKGSQGLGKTTLTEFLMPVDLKKYYYSGIIDPTNKDTMIYLSRVLLLNLDEFEKISPNKEAALKSIITQGAVPIRKAYARYEETMIRRASFIGSTNEEQILSDLTGSRRYLIYELTDKFSLKGIDIDKVWAEIYALYKSGFRHYFNGEDEAKITAHNNRYRYISDVEEVLLRYFEPSTIQNPRYLSASEILKYLKAENLVNHSTKATYLGRLLTHLGYSKKVINGVTKYNIHCKSGKSVYGIPGFNTNLPF